jgi:uncharacterized protein (TIGR02145 family)
MKIILNLIVVMTIVIITSACGDKTPPKIVKEPKTQDIIVIGDKTPPKIVKEPKTQDIIVIGNQTWRAKNLDVTTFLNGDAIPEAKTDEEWKEAGENKQAAWCYYDNDPKNGVKYGKLYNWYAVNDARGLAPLGWHVSTDQEWTVLSYFLGGNDVAGKKMKNSSGWYGYGCKKCNGGSTEIKNICSACKGTQSNSSEPFSGNGTNSSGFSSLPGGARLYNGNFRFVGIFGFWWSASEYDWTDAWSRESYCTDSYLYRNSCNESDGLSVRCVKN